MDNSIVYEFKDLKLALPSTKTVYGLLEGTKVRHRIIVRHRKVKHYSTWIGVIVDGSIYHDGKCYSKPSLFIRAHTKQDRGSVTSLSNFRMEVCIEDAWIPYDIYIS